MGEGHMRCPAQRVAFDEGTWMGDSGAPKARVGYVEALSDHG